MGAMFGWLAQENVKFWFAVQDFRATPAVCA
jgi:hypothetical protein